MDLFDAQALPDINLLPYDGEALYLGKIFDEQQSERHMQTLLKQISWSNERIVVRGQTVTAGRKVAWYGDANYSYVYSATKKIALPWLPELLPIKTQVEEKSAEFFNACLLNLYADGSQGMGWHSDAEKELVAGASIASLSLGAERRFVFKHKRSQEKVEVHLPSGALLLMRGQTQQHWLHSLPKTTKTSQARLNLTFRRMHAQ